MTEFEGDKIIATFGSMFTKMDAEAAGCASSEVLS